MSRHILTIPITGVTAWDEAERVVRERVAAYTRAGVRKDRQYLDGLIAEVDIAVTYGEDGWSGTATVTV